MVLLSSLLLKTLLNSTYQPWCPTEHAGNPSVLCPVPCSATPRRMEKCLTKSEVEYSSHSASPNPKDVVSPILHSNVMMQHFKEGLFGYLEELGCNWLTFYNVSKARVLCCSLFSLPNRLKWHSLVNNFLLFIKLELKTLSGLQMHQHFLLVL